MAGAMFSPQAGMRISIKAQGSRLDPILFAYLRRPDDVSHTPFRMRGATARWWEGLFSPAIGKRWATREDLLLERSVRNHRPSQSPRLYASRGSRPDGTRASARTT